MAKLPALVSALAECDDRDRSTLDHIARVIREAGLIPTTKRGSGASDMTVREAANLLIGASTAEHPKSAAMVVPLYRSLIGQNLSPNDEQRGVFARISEARTFGDALETLIEGAPEVLASSFQYVDDAYGGNHTAEQLRLLKAMVLRGDLAAVEVIFSRPTPYAEMRVVTRPAGQERLQYHWRFMVDADLFMQGFYTDRRRDRTSTVTVGLRTLLALFAAVKG